MIQTRKPQKEIQVSGLDCACAHRTAHMIFISINAAFTDSTDISAPVIEHVAPTVFFSKYTHKITQNTPHNTPYLHMNDIIQ